MFKEFRDFALKGNLIDIAVGLVIATAFGAVVNAFVDGMFMPMVGKIFQIGDLGQAKWLLEPAIQGPDGKEKTAEVAVRYGAFLTTIINFIIVAWVMFMLIKMMNRLNPPPPPAPTGPTMEQLLTEIRDNLKK